MTDASIVVLRQEIEHELAFVVNFLKTRVEDCVPMASQHGVVTERLEKLKKRLEDKAAQLNTSVNEISHMTSFVKDTSAVRESRQVNEFKTMLELMCQVESNLCAINFNSMAPVDEARQIKEATDCLIQMSETWKAEPVFEKSCYLLSKDVNYSRMCLLTQLHAQCKDIISFSPSNGEGNFQMKTSIHTTFEASEVLSAMDILGQFKELAAKWSSRIFKDFCATIVNSRTAVDVYDHSMAKNSEHVFHARTRTTNAPVDLPAVFLTLTEFFTHLHEALSGVSIGTDYRPLTAVIGRSIEGQLIDLLLKNCISIAAPTVDQTDPAYVTALEKARTFRQKMIEWNFWNDSTPEFLEYAEANDAVFIDRRCLAVLTEAKRLICEPLIDLEVVGSGTELSEETRDEIRDAFPNASAQQATAHQQNYPKFMQLLKCQVSKSVVKLVDLLEKTLGDAVASKNEMLRARLLTTCQNILRLYQTIAPRHHRGAITSVPQAAAVFYNNNYFICHKIVMLPFTVLKAVENKELNREVYPIFVDNLWHLQEAATASVEEMLANTRRQIRSLLDDKDLFVGLAKLDNSKRCVKTITGCFDLIRSIHDVWKEVFSEAVFCKSLGNIVSFFLSDLINKFLDSEDIRATDAEAGAERLEETLSKLQPFFTIDGQTNIHIFCDSSYFRVKEVIFCLNGSLQGISDRWCDGKGPLAQWMIPSEVRGLIKALFMNTEQRKDLLLSIN